MAKIPKYFYFRVNPKLKEIELEDASDVDVVEVIRCGDCKYWDGHEYDHINGRCVDRDVNGFGRTWKADDFCSYAERQEDD